MSEATGERAAQGIDERVDALMARARAAIDFPQPIALDVPIRVGVDLGTAYTVITVTDAEGVPLAAATTFADVVRDGVVWDFAGASAVVLGLREDLEQATGRRLACAAVTLPPGVDVSDARAHRYVLESAGIECVAVIDEPTAANAVLRLREGAVVDIGGGTTGTAVVRGGVVVATDDEPGGGTHLSLVLAGGLGMSFEEAELLKRDAAFQKRYLPLAVPVFERQAGIVARAVAGYEVTQIVLVGGTCAFAGIDRVVARVTGVPCVVAPEPALVTPLGVAAFAPTITEDGALP
ncbi:ethanolamine utilization protein EutJ [Xylanimonas ulmi]|uniref:Ethanolamine utilization protein EutJ n=1 Tax=Xylanimonas ulmi TaxID=228973 RepID=A0A4Q7M2C4_9MICO|nr:ethanolamine utilization protein EutJ [Xylanibacterium ulmi]RZS60059.1 ethanolamine utilization protein EutJ [Xylanibacterium ulmi]